MPAGGCRAEPAGCAAGRTAVPAGGAAEVGEESGSEPLPKYVALTFDDGPRADTTSVLLEGLQQRGVKVTFF